MQTVVTTEQIAEGIDRLKRRLDEIDILTTVSVSYDDIRVTNLENAVSATVCSVFGPTSDECAEFRNFRIIGPVDSTMQRAGECFIDMLSRRFTLGLNKGRDRINGLIAGLNIRREGLFSAASIPGSVFDSRNYLPAIAADPVASLYRSRHYGQAVFEAVKRLQDAVRLKAERPDLDGVDLMRHAFSPNRPILAFSDRLTDSERNEQEGMMNLFVGVIQAIRNPRAHSSGYDDSPERALQYLDLINLLADRLDNDCRKI